MRYEVTYRLKSPVIVQDKLLYEGLVVELQETEQVRVLKELGILKEHREEEKPKKKKEVNDDRASD